MPLLGRFSERPVYGRVHRTLVVVALRSAFVLIVSTPGVEPEIIHFILFPFWRSIVSTQWPKYSLVLMTAG